MLSALVRRLTLAGPLNDPVESLPDRLPGAGLAARVALPVAALLGGLLAAVSVASLLDGAILALAVIVGMAALSALPFVLTWATVALMVRHR